MLFFLDVLQKARDEFELRKHMKNLHEEHQEKSSIENDLKTYSNEGLCNLNEKLSKEMAVTPLGTPLYYELIHQHNALTDEMQERDLLDIPF
jgi:UV DNA damage repair endonuclease